MCVCVQLDCFEMYTMLEIWCNTNNADFQVRSAMIRRQVEVGCTISAPCIVFVMHFPVQ